MRHSRFLLFSLSLNLIGFAAAVWLFVTLGGLGWVMNLGRGQTYAGGAHYRGRISVFETSPVCPDCVIFVGDSITEENTWTELDPQWLNRGISGDRIAGVKARLAEITRHQPRHVHILVGINDLLHDGRDAAYLVSQYRAIIEQIRRESPKTQIIIAGILPVNPPMYRQATGSPRMTDALNKHIQAANVEIRSLTVALGVQFVDHSASLATPDGVLDARFTFDGLHLNGLGYRQLLKGLM